jgi:hypothetical protein
MLADKGCQAQSQRCSTPTSIILRTIVTFFGIVPGHDALLSILKFSDHAKYSVSSSINSKRPIMNNALSKVGGVGAGVTKQCE